jgi:hypothetical protein
MTAGWSVVVRQEEAGRWLKLSQYAFLLRHFETVAANQLPVREVFTQLPDAPRRELTEFIRFGQELYILEWDLTECLNEFKTGYQLAANLTLKKFSVVYHTDNFNARVYKLIENVEALLALLGGIDPELRPGKGEPTRRESMEKSLKEEGRHSILKLIRRFRERDSIKGAVEVRNRFVHLYRRDGPDWRWSLFVPATRIREYETASDPFAVELQRIVEPPHVDDYADAQADRLLEALREVQQCRDDLYGALLAHLAVRVTGQNEETQLRFKFVLDQHEVWREFGNEAARARADHADHGTNSDRAGNAGDRS